jgi:2-iminobutanoate/2-iminopropanoate deaminase
MKRQVFGTSKTLPISSAVIAEGKFVFVSGMGPGKEEMDKGIEEQTRATMDSIKAVLEELGSSMDNIVKATVFLKDMAHYDAMNKVYGSYFKKEPPARTCVQIVRSPASEKQLVEIEVIALVP